MLLGQETGLQSEDARVYVYESHWVKDSVSRLYLLVSRGLVFMSPELLPACLCPSVLSLADPRGHTCHSVGLALLSPL